MRSLPFLLVLNPSCPPGVRVLCLFQTCDGPWESGHNAAVGRQSAPCPQLAVPRADILLGACSAGWHDSCCVRACAGPGLGPTQTGNRPPHPSNGWPRSFARARPGRGPRGLPWLFFSGRLAGNWSQVGGAASGVLPNDLLERRCIGGRFRLRKTRVVSQSESLLPWGFVGVGCSSVRSSWSILVATAELMALLWLTINDCQEKSLYLLK